MFQAHKQTDNMAKQANQNAVLICLLAESFVVHLCYLSCNTYLLELNPLLVKGGGGPSTQRARFRFSKSGNKRNGGASSFFFEKKKRKKFLIPFNVGEAGEIKY